MKYLLAAVIACIAGPLLAQDSTLFQGAWINAEFIQELQKSRSVVSAMAMVPEGQPLWVEIDGLGDDSVVPFAHGFEEERSMALWHTNLHGQDMRWVLGENGRGRWLVTADQKSGAYIALFDLASLQDKPIVLGKLPAERQDAKFILERIISATIVAGRWTDGSGGFYEFKTNMNGSWNGADVRMKFDVQPDTNDALLTLKREDGSTTMYRAIRTDDVLSLQAGNSEPLMLKRLTD